MGILAPTIGLSFPFTIGKQWDFRLDPIAHAQPRLLLCRFNVSVSIHRALQLGTLAQVGCNEDEAGGRQGPKGNSEI